MQGAQVEQRHGIDAAARRQVRQDRSEVITNSDNDQCPRAVNRSYALGRLTLYSDSYNGYLIGAQMQYFIETTLLENQTLQRPLWGKQKSPFRRNTKWVQLLTSHTHFE